MARKHRLSRDQRRKVKLKEKRSRLSSSEPVGATPYHGTKYQGEELADVCWAIESGIHDADLELRKTLLDDDVAAAVQLLITELRGGRSLEALELEPVQDAVEVIVVSHVVDRWRILREHRDPPGRSELIGVLRTILASVDTRGEMELSPRGYLDFLARFMTRGEVL